MDRTAPPVLPALGGTALYAPDLPSLLLEAGRLAGEPPEERPATSDDGVYQVGSDRLLFTADLRDEGGRPLSRGILLSRWTQAMVAGRAQLIPRVPFYKDHQGLLYRCALTYLRNLPLALHGHTGVGKTELVRYFATLLGAPLYRMNLHGLSTTDDIIGKLLPGGRGTVVFQDGLATTAVRRGGILLLEEMNATGQEVWFALHGLLDNTRALVLVEKDNELVPQHPWCRLYSTFNPSEYPNLYPGTKPLSAAYLRRWSSVRVEFAPLEIERRIVEASFPEFAREPLRRTLDAILEVTRVARRLLLDPARSFDFVMSTGVLLAWADLTRDLGPVEAARTVYYDLLNEPTKALFRDQMFSYLTDWDTGQLESRPAE
jgi:MoxR-like ATPase